MSVIETVSDVNNTFLSRRELVCNFAGLAGKLKKLDAADMVAKKFELNGKIVIPVNMRSHVGKPLTTGTFYVYESEELAKRQVSPVVFARLDRAKKKAGEEEGKAGEEEGKAAGESRDKAAEGGPSQAGAGKGQG